MGKKFGIYDSHEQYDIEEVRADIAERDEVEPDEITDEQVYEYIDEDLQFAFECECDNLAVPLEGKILAIADLGLWNGRRQGYALLSDNLADIMTNGNGDAFKIFSDGKDIRKITQHHDGTNYILYREVRKGVNINNLTVRIYNGENIPSKTLNYYTKSLVPAVRKVYGN